MSQPDVPGDEPGEISEGKPADGSEPSESPADGSEPNEPPADGSEVDGGGRLPVRRRTVLAGAGGGIVGAGLGFGSGFGLGYLFGNDTLPPDVLDREEIPDDHVPFSIWEDVQTSFRGSPDHLPGTAEELVAEGDPEAIFEFVRDEIVTVPTSRDDTSDTEEGTRWGPRGTLRCGMGTPRDKADLLAELYRRAGYQATVKSADDGFSEDDARAHYRPDVERVFQPALDEETLDDWRDRLDHDEPPEGSFEVVDDGGTDSRALADRIRQVMPDPTDGRGSPNEFDWRWGSRNRDTPVVEVPFDGTTRYANLFNNVPFGDPGGSVSEIRERDDPDPVRVTLSAVTPRTMDEPFELVSGEWDVHQLVGRQLLVRTPTLVAPYEHPTARIGDMDLFTPSLVLQGADLSREEAIDASAFGDPFSLRGDRLSSNRDPTEEPEDAIISRNGEPFVNPTSGVDPTDVDTLELAASPSDYPTIRLDVTALDDDGEHVEGLPASAFSATDEGEEVMPTLAGTAARAHVLYVRDVSGSMGRVGVDGADDDEWFEELRAVIEDHPSKTRIEYWEVDSAMWTHLTDAIAESPDLIVFAHDGEDTDEHVESMDPLLENAPPTVLISAVDESEPVEDETTLEQAAITGASVAPMGDWDAVVRTVTGALDGLEVPTYRFDYYVPDYDGGTREVELTLGEGNRLTSGGSHRSASATYRVGDGNPLPRTLVGLYLTVEVDGEEVTRTLGGWDPELDGSWNPYRDDPDPETGIGPPGIREHARDVHSAVLGGATLSFEGDGVPFSVAVDDVLEGRQSFAPKDVAAVDGDEEAVEGALEQGGMVIPHDLLLVQSPLPDAASGEGVTFFTSPRIALLKQKQLLGTDEVEFSIDVLPLATAATVIEDPEERFWKTLERTARIAVIEDAAFDVTTSSLLAGSELVHADDFDADHDHRADYDDLRSRAGFSHRDHQLVPADGSEFAFWNVHSRTGTLTGVLDDGSGGGRTKERLQRRLDELSQVMDFYNVMLYGMMKGGAVSAGGAAALGFVAIYGQQLARMYAAVVLVLATMDARHLEEQARKAVAQMVCEVAKEITLGSFDVFGDLEGLIGEVLGLTDNTVGAIGGTSPLSCGIDL